MVATLCHDLQPADGAAGSAADSAVDKGGGVGAGGVDAPAATTEASGERSGDDGSMDHANGAKQEEEGGEGVTGIELSPEDLERQLQSRDFGSFLEKTSTYVERALGQAAAFDFMVRCLVVVAFGTSARPWCNAMQCNAMHCNETRFGLVWLLRTPLVVMCGRCCVSAWLTRLAHCAAGGLRCRRR